MNSIQRRLSRDQLLEVLRSGDPEIERELTRIIRRATEEERYSNLEFQKAVAVKLEAELRARKVTSLPSPRSTSNTFPEWGFAKQMKGKE